MFRAKRIELTDHSDYWIVYAGDGARIAAFNAEDEARRVADDMNTRLEATIAATPGATYY